MVSFENEGGPKNLRRQRNEKQNIFCFEKEEEERKLRREKREKKRARVLSSLLFSAARVSAF